MHAAWDLNARASPMMTIAARLDELARPAWIALIVLGFIFWWPLGLAILAFGLWSGKMGCCGVGFTGRHHDADRIHQAEDRWRQPRTSGSRAFDEYRVETLRRLEEEQRQFHEFLGRLRMARDKAEFDQFMAVRRARTEPPASTPPA